MNENPENWQCAYAAFALHLFYMTQLSTGLDFNLRHYGISLEVYEIYEFGRFFFVFYCMASVNHLFCNTDILESIGMIRMRELGTM